MKYALITFIGLFMNFFGSCQGTENGEKAMKQLSELYNNNAYAGLYAMLAPEFKAQASEAEITDFYRSSLKPMGNIVSWKAAGSKDGALNYRVEFANGALDLIMYLNAKIEIAGIQWLPAKDKPTGKKRDAHSIKSNNPKQTALQLLIDSIAVAHLQNPVNCGLSIGIIYGDKTELYFYGSTNKENNKLPDANTLYEIGSITKTFTGILLAHAINDGKISLEDDITKYLPGAYPNLQYKGNTIKIKHLATHTSRLPRIPQNLDKQPTYDEQDPYKNYSKEMMLEYLKTVKPDTMPGTVNEYSNYGVALLGMIIESVYKKPLEELVRMYITEPVKMSSTKFTVPANEQQHMATGYYEHDGSPAPYWNLGAFSGAGGLKSDITDMMSYMQANMKEINADFKLSHQVVFKEDKMSVGLNWMMQTTKDNQTLVWHNGGTYGFKSFCGYLKEKNISVVVLNNSGVSIDGIAISILKELKKN